jgi:hypothetical protein
MNFPGKQTAAEDEQGTVLLLQVPRTNDKKELAAEQMLASLHGLLFATESRRFGNAAKRERISFEIAVKAKRIGFYVWVPTYLKSFVEEQIYAQYPSVHISEVPDYTLTDVSTTGTQLAAELKLVAPEALPIKTFPSFEVDPLAAITATLAQFEASEEAWLQMIVRPAPEAWYKQSERYASGIRSGTGGTSVLSMLWAAPGGTTGSATKLAEYQSARANAAEEKSHKLAYELTVRVVYRGQASAPQARMRMQAITASFKQFNTTYLNGFTHKVLGDADTYIDVYRSRAMNRKNFICNIEEVASLYHLPHTNVETPNILWASAKTAEPPATLPLATRENYADVSRIAVTNFRGHNTVFGMPRADRGRHMYIIGQTGTGKSALMELLTISDIYSQYGIAVVDPHGDYAQNVLRRIPEHRMQDVIYFNPADTAFPIAFNPMEVYDDKLKTHTASELIGVLKRMFDSWGPRLEYILRYSLLALLDYPDATMLDITRILTDKRFRQEVLTYVSDPVVRNFWTVEFASWNDKFASEAVAPVLNKVGAFTANPVVRNIIGQPKSSFNIRDIMDQRKILIVNLSRGLIGEDNASLLGALLVTKIQMAAMSRADVDLAQRVPFYLYVDEFQNFATDSFATILSEARKYALNLTVANQYIAQMMDTVRDAVFGNVGSIISFRTSADDARTMLRYFEPKFEEHDLVHMHNRHFAISMTIEGEKAQAFSATTVDLPPSPPDLSAQIIDASRRQYGSNLEQVELFMNVRYMADAKTQPTPKPRAIERKNEDQQPPAPVVNEGAPVRPTRPARLLPGLLKGITHAVVHPADDVMPVSAQTMQPLHTQDAIAEENVKPKRKRKRTRRKKTVAATMSASVDVPTTDPTELIIAH